MTCFHCMVRLGLFFFFGFLLSKVLDSTCFWLLHWSRFQASCFNPKQRSGNTADNCNFLIQSSHILKHHASDRRGRSSVCLPFKGSQKKSISSTVPVRLCCVEHDITAFSPSIVITISKDPTYIEGVPAAA